jgi:hypothetical protein
MGIKNLFAAFVACVSVAGCGGGGGGGGSGSSSGGQQGSSHNTISVSQSTLDFRGFNSVDVPQQSITATFSGAGVVIGYPPGVVPAGWLMVSAASTVSNSPATVNFNISPNQDPGTYSTVIRLVTGTAAGNNLTWTDVTVRYQVDRAFFVDAPSTVQFESIEGGLNGPAPAGGVSVSLLGTNSSWTATPSQPWITVTPSSGSNASSPVVRVTAPQGTAKGTYTGEVTFHDSVRGATFHVPVTHTVRDTALALSQNWVTWPLTPGSVAGDLTTALQVRDEIGGVATGYNLRWSATVDKPWVQLSTNSGNTGTPVTLNVSAIPEPLRLARPGATVANITFNFANDHGAGGVVTVPVTAQVRLPLARAVTPYRVDPGSARTVTLRGEDLADEDLTRLRLDGATVNATRVNGTAWNVALPSLTAGEHRLTFTNALGLDRSFAYFQVAPGVAPPPGFIAQTDEKSRVLYDEIRGRIYVLNRTQARVERYRWSGASWVAMTAIPVAEAQDIDFDRTGRELYALANSAIYRIDLDAAVPVAVPWMPSAGHELLPLNPDFGYLGVLDSGVGLAALQFPGSGSSNTLAIDLLRGDQALNQFNTPQFVATAYEGRINVSSDGRYAAIGECCLSPGGELYLVDGRAGTGPDLAYAQFRIDSGRSNYRYMGFDTANQRLLGDYSLFDISDPPPVYPPQNPAPLVGTIPENLSYALLSPDGRRLYVLVVYGGATNRVMVYDTQAVVGGKFTKLGEVSLAMNVADLNDDLHHYPSTAYKFSGLITPDGQRIILSGTRGIAVLDVPPL